MSVTYDLCYCEYGIETPVRLFCVSHIVELRLSSIKRDSGDFYISCRERIYFFSFYLERKFNNGVYAMEVCIKVHELVL